MDNKGQLDACHQNFCATPFLTPEGLPFCFCSDLRDPLDISNIFRLYIRVSLLIFHGLRAPLCRSEMCGTEKKREAPFCLWMRTSSYSIELAMFDYGRCRKISNTLTVLLKCWSYFSIRF